ncbi:hypothetical protein W97_07894 [Coniosporium apollinis CBS 100218]|uniref:Glycoside hydrolase family 31 TIM barrel domain-containing protein n=1 Tax=Coniosporium apollinis (strain CBS 100218) TaxID=1168221 RepID=R7Z410_CONA1|nr:uncharacterized protein W97_07894 [Coniosporium apollinis CBS 100218]EON68636.1 hypothetical protein W97_07894 [Coniosporium apollinis CBS 100218]
MASRGTRINSVLDQPYTGVRNDSLSTWYRHIPLDGIWIDLSDAASYVVRPHSDLFYLNPAHLPFSLPGEPGTIDYRYLEGFNVTNATEAASASSDLSKRRHGFYLLRDINLGPHGADARRSVSQIPTYEMHNLFGHRILNATYNNPLSIFPNRRPFLLRHLTFAGNGAIGSY